MVANRVAGRTAGARARDREKSREKDEKIRLIDMSSRGYRGRDRAQTEQEQEEHSRTHAIHLVACASHTPVSGSPFFLSIFVYPHPRSKKITEIEAHTRTQAVSRGG